MHSWLHSWVFSSLLMLLILGVLVGFGTVLCALMYRIWGESKEEAPEPHMSKT